MEKRFHDVDHRAQLSSFRSPSSVSSGAPSIHKNLKNLFLIETYSTVGTQLIQLLFESHYGIDSTQF